MRHALVDLLAMAEAVGQCAQMVRPIIDTDPPAPVPPLPSLEIQAKVAAKVGAYGSTETRRLMQAWRDMVTEILKADRMIGFAQARPLDNLHPAEFWKAITEKRPEEERTRQALTDHVARELGHRVDA